MADKKYLDYDGLVELVGKLKEYIGDTGKLEFKGKVDDVTELPELTEQKIGYMYTILEEGFTTSNFTDGSGLKIAANSEVAVVEVDVDGTLTKKWCLLGPIFDVSNKLTFGTVMPSNPSNGDIFLFMGNTTYDYNYTEVTPEGTENPSEEGWYVEDGEGRYEATSDETVQAGTTYYTRTQVEQYVTGVIYKYDSTSSEWVAQSSGDTMIAISNEEIDALFV